MISKAIKLTKLTFSKTVNDSTDQGRSNKRYQRIARTAVTGVFARVVNISTGLITVPLTLSYLGNELFGLWMAITSFVAFLSFTDLGLGIGLQNSLSECDGKDDKVRPKGLVSSAMFVMAIISSSLVLITLFILPLLDLSNFIKASEETTKEAILPTAQAVIIAFAFGLPCGLIQRVYNAYQRGYIGNLLLASGRVLGFLGVLSCIWMKLSLPVLAFAMMGLPFFSLALGSIFLFYKTPYLRPEIKFISKDDIKSVFRIGLLGLGAQIAFCLLSSSPAILIANKIGADSVTPYSISQRLLSVANVILGVALLPLWPAYGEAKARGDMQWVRRTFLHSVKVSMMVAIPVFVLILFLGQSIILFWTNNKQAVPSFSLLMACNTCSFLMMLNIVLSMFLNGINKMKGQASYGIAISLVVVTVCYLWDFGENATALVWTFVIIGWGARLFCMILEVLFNLREFKKGTTINVKSV